jgi:hypothetical protein
MPGPKSYIREQELLIFGGLAVVITFVMVDP